jgi:hypothetical protein
MPFQKSLIVLNAQTIKKSFYVDNSATFTTFSHFRRAKEYLYAYSAISPKDRKIDSFIVPYAEKGVMSIFLHQVSASPTK